MYLQTNLIFAIWYDKKDLIKYFKMKKTKINRAHYLLKGKMVDFLGWDMPVHYSGLSNEHNAVRNTGGIFDVSHMGEIFVKGQEALNLLQYITLYKQLSTYFDR